MRYTIIGIFPQKNDVYPLVICYSLPWKDPAFLRTLNSGKPSINEQIHL